MGNLEICIHLTLRGVPSHTAQKVADLLGNADTISGAWQKELLGDFVNLHRMNAQTALAILKQKLV